LGIRDLGLAGEGLLATVRFRVLGEGDPAITVATVDARNARNERLDLQPVAPADLTQAAPRVTQLLPNVPNPFNPTTRIPFTLSASGPVDLAVYTVDGRRLRTLVAGEREPGLYDAIWNGTDERGDRVSSGVYYVRLVMRDLTLSRPVVLLK
ncbi:MAG: putative Gingipain, partial [Deltaproteobacteria bacterium]|nr:putative Gingipain [Deltaproteobacteria bacterium]